jgi:hypothetical protein
MASLTGDADMAIQAALMGNHSRQNVAAAHELCAKEALARGRHTKILDVEAIARQAEAETEARRAKERSARVRIAEVDESEHDAAEAHEVGA